mmetsp:Transcript_20453/g.48528  ORF Transcript_20453/g.48528 Transcript_20453/m.48528 type:complete len:249 (+) Transcript_20453:749-1495(+)
MPKVAMICIIALRQPYTLTSRSAGTGTAHEVKAKPALFLANHKDFWRNKACILIHDFEALQIPGKRAAAAQPLLHIVESGHVPEPIWPAAGSPVGKVGIVVQLRTELLQPSIDGSGTVVDRVSHVLVPGIGLLVPCSPHVRNLRTWSCHNLAAANPHPYSLVDILSTPSQHLVIVPATLVPPVPGHPCQASRQHTHVHVISTAPLEVTVPGQVAFGHASPTAYLSPCVNVECSDLRNHHASVILTDKM